MRMRGFRLGVAAFAALTISILTADPASAAAPWIIIVDGDPLAEPVYITDFHDNQTVLNARGEGQVGDLEGRPYFDLALYWGPSWEDYVSSGRSLEELRPDQTGEHGRFYPAYNGSPAVLRYVSRHVIGTEGLDILQRYGVPIELSADELFPGMPDTGAGGTATDNSAYSRLTLVIGLITAATFVIGLGVRPRKR